MTTAARAILNTVAGRRRPRVTITAHGQGKRTYPVLFLIVFSVSLGVAVISPFLPLYLKDAGTDGVSIAIVFSAYALAKFLFAPLFGRWSDNGCRRALINTGLCLYCLVSLAYLSFPVTLAWWAVFLVMQGLAAALVRPLALASVANTIPSDRKGIAMGTFDISFYLAASIGPIVAGTMRDALGYWGVFGALSLLSFFSLFLGLFVLSDSATETGIQERETTRMSRIFRNTNLLALFCFIFSRSFGIVLCTIFLPLLLSASGLNGLQIGTVVALSTIPMAIFLRSSGRIADRADRAFLIKAGGLSAAILTCFFPDVHGFWYPAVISTGIGLLSTVTLPATSILLIEEGNRYGMGLTMGLFNSATNLGFIVAPLIGGVLFDHFGLAWVFYTAGLIGVVGMCAFCLLYRGDAQKGLTAAMRDA